MPGSPGRPPVGEVHHHADPQLLQPRQQRDRWDEQHAHRSQRQEGARK